MKNIDKLIEAHERCPYFFFDYTNHHRTLFDGLKNEEYFIYTDYAMWLTAMGMLDTLILIDKRITDL